MNVFRDLASPEASVREAAAEALVAELRDVQSAYEESKRDEDDEAAESDAPPQMEAEKEDGLDNCAPAVRYAIRRLIRGISSSREVRNASFLYNETCIFCNIHRDCCCFTLQNLL
jgi:DNA polymerase phi